MNNHLRNPMTTPQQLKRRYPYMFAGPNIGISISRGWMPIFEQLCQDIDVLLGADKRGFHFVQCKEKFGSARWYWGIKPSPPPTPMDLMDERGVSILSLEPIDLEPDSRRGSSLSAQLNTLIKNAESQVHHACIACGAPGVIDRQSSYLLMLCPEHASQRRTGSLAGIWFEENER